MYKDMDRRKNVGLQIGHDSQRPSQLKYVLSQTDRKHHGEPERAMVIVKDCTTRQAQLQ